MKSKTKLNAILNAVRLTLAALVPFIIFIPISRIFGVDTIGRIDFAKSIITVTSLIASLGIYSYAMREGVRVRDNRKDFSKFVHEMFVINLIALIIAISVLLVSIFFIPQFRANSLLIFLYMIQVPFVTLGLDWIFGVYEDYAYITIRQIVLQIIVIVLVFVLIRQNTNFDVILYVSILVGSNVISGMMNYFRAKKYFDFKIQSNYNFKKHITPIFLLLLPQLSNQIFSYVGTLLIGIFESDHDVGLYNTALKIPIIIITFFSAMVPVFLPSITEAAKRKDIDEVNNLIHKTFFLFSMFLYPIIIGIIMLGNSIILIYAGDSFVEGAGYLSVLMAVAGFIIISYQIKYEILIPLNDDKFIFWATMISSIMSLGLAVLGVLIFGVIGVAVASLITESLFMIIFAIRSHKSGIKVFRNILKPVKYLIVALVTIIPSVLIINYLDMFASMQNGYVLEAVLSTVIGALLYFVGLLIIRDDMLIGAIIKIKERLNKKQEKE